MFFGAQPEPLFPAAVSIIISLNVSAFITQMNGAIRERMREQMTACRLLKTFASKKVIYNLLGKYNLFICLPPPALKVSLSQILS
jgi:hypothetical protein